MVERRLLLLIQLQKRTHVQQMIAEKARNTAYLQDVREDVFLHGSVVHPNRATPDFDPVQHEVIVLSANLPPLLSR